jgi:hypothetical protein
VHYTCTLREVVRKDIREHDASSHAHIATCKKTQRLIVNTFVEVVEVVVDRVVDMVVVGSCGGCGCQGG